MLSWKISRGARGLAVRRGRLPAIGLVAWLVVAGSHPVWSAGGPLSESSPQTGIAWEENLSAAMSRCATEKKPVFISFSTRNGGDTEAPFY